MKKFICSLVFALVLSVSALAQYPTSPNTGQATTPYATSTFSITFNGPVVIEAAVRNTENTSTDVTYDSNNGNIYQMVTIRTIDHAIPVDFTSSNYYVEHQTGCDTKTDLTTGYWDNRPYSYSFCTFSIQGEKYTLRTRYIIVDSTTMLRVQQVAKEDDNNRDAWLDFEYSLRIRN